MVRSEQRAPAFPYRLVLIFFLLTAGVGIAGYLYYASQKEHLISQMGGELSAIADLKTSQITTWRRERILDGSLLVSPPLLSHVREFVEKPGGPHREELLAWLKMLKKQPSYYGASLVDTKGTLLLSSEIGEAFGAAGEKLVAEALEEKKIVLSDFHSTPATEEAHIDLVVPLSLTDGGPDAPLGVLFIRIDPNRFLYPLIQSWPTPSGTAETLLVRREGDKVLFLNELRHRKDTAMKLALPLTEHLPAAMAVRGRKGVVEEIDYRGVPVLAAIRAVPESPWFLVAKIDREEVYAPIRRRARLVAIIALSLIAASGAGAGFWWKRQSEEYYRAQCETELLRRAEREKAQESLRESEERYRSLFANLLDAFCYCKMMFDDEGRPVDYLYLEANSAFETMNGFTDVVGKRVTDIIPGVREAHPEMIETFGRVAMTGRPEKFEIHFTPTHRWFDVSAYSTKKGYVAIIFDNITERKQAEEKLKRYAAELKRSNEELQQFAYIASHDLQEPLRMISSYLQLIEKRYKDKLDKDADEFIAFAVDGASRLQQMIIGLLAYSRVGTKGKPFEEVNSAEVLGTAIMNMKIAIEESGALVTTDRLPVVRADEVQLVQLFQNLLSNSIKFSMEGQPRIHISAEHNDAEWVFSVRDNGIGISPEYKDRIFNIFQRLHGREYPGVGIGLSLCRKIVERHGGRIWFESEAGKGTTFYFTIPIKEGEKA
ncbi:MAG: ATP-binding protein [Nitrospirae bacterium]|nr:ATP-binding protein [Nitrospirota bacterium]